MRFPRMTTRRWMIAVVLASLMLAAFVARRERLRRVAALQAARAAYQNARLTREVAEIAVSEYLPALGEIAVAKSELKRAEDRLEWSNRMLEKGSVSKAQNVADKVGLEQKRFALEQAQTKLLVLERYTREKALKELRSEVEKAKAKERARKAAYEREKAALERGIW